MTIEGRPRCGNAQHTTHLTSHPTQPSRLSRQPARHERPSRPETLIERALGRRGRALLGAALAAALATGCVTKEGPPELPPQPPPTFTEAISDVADHNFEDALTTMATVDKKGWDADSCRRVATAFAMTAQRLEGDAAAIKKRRDDPAKAAAKPGEPKLTAERANALITDKLRGARFAHYNEGVVLERCGLRERAKAVFKKLLKEHPKFHQARVQLARFTAARHDDASVKEAMGELSQAIRDASFANADALVMLARLQMQVAKQGPASERGEALDKARKNLQRALAVQDNHLPAYNQLALNYLQRARIRKQDSGRPDVAMLEMAALICAQAIARKANFAPIHNTAGIIAAERGDPGTAARSFNRARQLDASLFEAHMNFAAVNLQFRGFKQARNAYEVALKQRPKSYDAMVGLALALRGMASDQADDPLIGRARKLLHTARKLDERRPETYLNEAILILEYEARYASGDTAKKAMKRARTLLTSFMTRSGKLPRYADARRRAQGRLDDIAQLARFEQQPTANP